MTLVILLVVIDTECFSFGIVAQSKTITIHSVTYCQQIYNQISTWYDKRETAPKHLKDSPANRNSEVLFGLPAIASAETATTKQLWLWLVAKTTTAK